MFSMEMTLFSGAINIDWSFPPVYYIAIFINSISNTSEWTYLQILELNQRKSFEKDVFW
ncbi:MAG: hypothetical protein ACTSRU_11265 [Candidatus Hodarchaeales archaeon]